eukprot:m.308832 g.308832  ORF g.308832 m.308832 type:complete len:1714 (-) comp19634_c2_seq15:115-5256(-)
MANKNVKPTPPLEIVSGTSDGDDATPTTFVAAGDDGHLLAPSQHNDAAATASTSANASPSSSKRKKSPRSKRKETPAATASPPPPQPAVGPPTVGKQHKSQDGKKKAMKTSTDVIKRIIWDPDVPAHCCVVGYDDRFLGILEKSFAAFDWSDYASLSHLTVAIPKHRIVYFKYRNRIVWDKRTRLDDVFGSLGGEHLQDVVQAYDLEHGPPDAPDVGSSSSASASSGAASVASDSQRPNFFVCFRVDNPRIVAQANKIQQAMVAANPRLQEACIPTYSLHVTLLTLRLTSSAEIAKAAQVLQGCQAMMKRCVPRASALRFSGVSAFRRRVVYGRLDESDQARITDLHKELLRTFGNAGLSLVGNRPEFVPHMTLIKLNGALAASLGHIEDSEHMAYAAMPLGTQSVEGIHLCHMTTSKAADMFYLRESSVYNCAPVVLCADAVAVVCDSVVHHSNNHQVVVLRGLPGAGKSTVAASLAAAFAGHVVTCSADSYFIKDGVYTFDPTKLQAAHDACRTQFQLATLPQEAGSADTSSSHAEQTNSDDAVLVIVDNTNSRLSEYAFYIDTAQRLGWHTHVIELACPSRDALKPMQSRGKHGVGLDTLERMYDRWESDPMAMLVASGAISHGNGAPAAGDRPLLVLNAAVAATRALPARMYSAVFLDESSRQRLLARFPPVHPEVFADHMTICFEPSRELLATLPIGQPVELTVKAHVHDSKGQALLVAPSTSLSSTNNCLHVTVSCATGVSAAYSNTLLESSDLSGHGVPNDTLKLAGVVGVRLPTGPEDDDVVTVFKAEELRYFIGSGDTEAPIIDDMVTELNVFDFDGTLFDTPGRETGIAMYEEATGKPWPYQGFVSHRESLEPPMIVHPGPLLPLFRAYHGRHGSLTVVLTGRLEALRAQVESVCYAAGVFPDELLLRPKDPSKTTSEFKMAAVRDLLARHPGVTTLRLWDDLPANLAAFEALRDQLPIKVRVIDAVALGAKFRAKRQQSGLTSSMITSHLACLGLLPSGVFRRTAEAALDFVSGTWFDVLREHCPEGELMPEVGNPRHLALVFGSHPIGRMSDIDVCLVGPKWIGQHWRCVTALERALQSRGVVFTYAGASDRCPRLRIKLAASRCAPVDMDIVFALVPADEFAKVLADRASPEAVTAAEAAAVSPPPYTSEPVIAVDTASRPVAAAAVAGLVDLDDSRSQAAIQGPVITQRVLDRLQGRCVTLGTFGQVVEFTKLVLRMKHISGNALHGIRTYHVVELVSSYVQSLKKGEGESGLDPQPSWDADRLFAGFVQHAQHVPESDLAALFEKRVGEAFVQPFRGTLAMCAKNCDASSVNSIQRMLARPSFPSAGSVMAMISYQSEDKVALWAVDTFLSARFPSYSRRLATRGVVLLPDSDTMAREHCLRFSVPLGTEARKALLEEMRLLWKELQPYVSIGVSVQLTCNDDVLLEDHGTATTTSNASSERALADTVADFAQTAKAGQVLDLPTSLNSYERRLAHGYAKAVSLEHESVGVGAFRHVQLRKPQNAPSAPTPTPTDAATECAAADAKSTACDSVCAAEATTTAGNQPRKAHSCGIVVLRRSDKGTHVLVLRHRKRWDWPKGHMEPGEAPKTTALRELGEETGITSEMIDLVPDEVYRHEQSYTTVYRRKQGGGKVEKTVTLFAAFLRPECEGLTLTTPEHADGGYAWIAYRPGLRVQAKAIDPALTDLASLLDRDAAQC